MAKKNRWSTNDERLGAVTLMEEGKPPEVIAEILGVSRSSVFEWQRKYRSGGLAALSTKFSSGRPTFLTDDQMLKLRVMLIGKDPRQYSLGFALWTRELVGDLILQKFAVKLSKVTVGRVLGKLGMSAQRPAYQAHQQDPEKVRVWREVTYPAIKAQAAARDAKIFFADEAGVRTDHHAGTTWAPVGHTPVVVATGDRHSVNMISAVSAQGQLHYLVFEGRLNADLFIEYLKALLHDIDGNIFLIVDGSSVHTAKKTKEFVEKTEGRLTLFVLPPYSPQLNPDEWVWNNVKNHGVGRTVAMNRQHLRQIVDTALHRLQSLPAIVKGFFSDPHLSYINA